MITATRTATEPAGDRLQPRPVFFVILSAPRCGSWLLWTSLAQHPRAALYGELFNDEIYDRDPSALVLCSPPMIARPLLSRGEQSHEYLENLFVQFRSSSFGAVGFKLLYGQSRQHANALGLWPYLERWTDLRVVHVVRDNLFEAYVSLKTALATNQWTSQAGRKVHLPPMQLSADECHDYFRNQLRMRQEITQRFCHHDVFEAAYERDLVGNYAATMERAQAFLDLPPQRLSPAMRQQARGSVAQRVVNYSELRETFATTPFAPFFVAPRDSGGAA